MVKGVPVIVVEKGGIPVRSVDAGAPLLSVSENGLGVAVTLSALGAPFVIDSPNTPAKRLTTPDEA